MTIRPARAGDLDALAAIVLTAIRASFPTFLPADVVERWLADDAVGKYVAFALGSRVTWPKRPARWLPAASPNGDLLDLLMVHPARQGRGFGGALLADAEERLFDAHPVIRLESFAANTAANRFYEAARVADHGPDDGPRHRRRDGPVHEGGPKTVSRDPGAHPELGVAALQTSPLAPPPVTPGGARTRWCADLFANAKGHAFAVRRPPCAAVAPRTATRRGAGTEYNAPRFEDAHAVEHGTAGIWRRSGCPIPPRCCTCFRDADVRRYLLDGKSVSAEWVTAEIRASERRFGSGGGGLWALRPRSDPTVIGFVGFRAFFEPPEPQLLYGLLPAYWGQGLATEAAAAACRFAFETLGWTEARAAIDVPNVASGAVLERLRLPARTYDGGRHRVLRPRRTA